MGQNVNYLLGNQSTMLGADPELYRQQLIQQEQQRIAAMPAMNQLGAQVGSLLGRGITNVAQGRGFMEVTNPVLQKLTQIQDIYNTSMQQSDPNDPMSFYRSLQKNFADAGLGQQAMMATEQLKKAESENIKTEVARTELYKNNLPLLNADIAKFREAGNDKKANELADMLGRFQLKEDNAQKAQYAEIAYKQAATQAQLAQANNLNKQAAAGKLDKTSVPDGNGGATIIYYDTTTRKKVDEIHVTSAIVEDYLKGKGGKDGKAPPPGERPPLNTFGGAPGQATTPVAAPASVPAATTPQAELPALDPQTKMYYAARDPVLKAIQAAAQADPNRLASDPEWFKQLTNARNQQIEYLRNQYGNMVSFQGL